MISFPPHPTTLETIPSGHVVPSLSGTSTRTTDDITDSTTTGRLGPRKGRRRSLSPERGLLIRRSSYDPQQLRISEHNTGSNIPIPTPLRRQPRAVSESNTSFDPLSVSVHSQWGGRSHRRLASRNDPQFSSSSNSFGFAGSVGGPGSTPASARFGSTPPRSRSGNLLRARSIGAASGAGGTFNMPGDHASVMESPTVIPDRQQLMGEPVPRLQCRIGMEEIKVVFTTRHYELLNFFLSTITRMKNGRPDKVRTCI